MARLGLADSRSSPKRSPRVRALEWAEAEAAEPALAVTDGSGPRRGHRCRVQPRDSALPITAAGELACVDLQLGCAHWELGTAALLVSLLNEMVLSWNADVFLNKQT